VIALRGLEDLSSDIKRRDFLQDHSQDPSAYRDNIRRELQQHGHQVLPYQPLPLNAPALEKAVRGCLPQAKLSIHLIGPHYGIIPEDEAQILRHYQGFNQKPLAPFLTKPQQSNRASL
jgi:hypothetical protein